MPSPSWTLIQDSDVSGEVSPDSGWVIDFGDISKAFAPLHSILDYSLLNEIDGVSNPISENISIWIWKTSKSVLPNLSKVVVHKTCTSGCVYVGQTAC